MPRNEFDEKMQALRQPHSIPPDLGSNEGLPSEVAALSSVGSAQERWEANQRSRDREANMRALEDHIPLLQLREDDRMPTYQMEAESEAGRETLGTERPSQRSIGERAVGAMMAAVKGVNPNTSALIDEVTITDADRAEDQYNDRRSLRTGTDQHPFTPLSPAVFEDLSAHKGGPLNRENFEGRSGRRLMRTLEENRALTHRLWSEGTLSDEVYAELVPVGERMRLTERPDEGTAAPVIHTPPSMRAN